jgi:asparagine synthase (glutamine-hydrolysing)
MCGIAGIWHRDGANVERSVVESMTDAIAHRGPDGAGIHVRGSIGLGHRRLKIIDLSSASAHELWHRLFLDDDRSLVRCPVPSAA